MNHYGDQAKRHWQEFLPRRYQALADPDSFFEELGERVAGQVDELQFALAGDDPPGEGYMGKLGRLNMARLMAEEKVLREEVLLPAEDDEDETADEE